MDDKPYELIPEELRNAGEGDVVTIDLNRPMKDVCQELSKYPIGTRLSLNGTIIVGRDIAHAKLKERIDRGEGLPQYIKDHPIYYAGPAKTPAGMACGSMGPTTAGRMDSYVDLFQSNGGSLIMLAKGNRAQCVTDACIGDNTYPLQWIDNSQCQWDSKHAQSSSFEQLPNWLWRLTISPADISQ